MHPCFRLRADAIRAAGRISRQAIETVRMNCHPGVSTAWLDECVARVITDSGAVALMRLAPRADGSRASSSISINDEATETIPGDRVVRSGDLITVDVPVSHAGFAADMSRSWVVPAQKCSQSGSNACHADGALVRDRQRLLDATHAVNAAAIASIRPGVRWSTVAAGAENRAVQLGYHLIRGFAGHAIGTEMHEAPRAPLPRPRVWSLPDRLPLGDFSLCPGLVLTIEPILTLGPSAVIDPGPGLGVRTRSGADACTVERMVLVTDDGVELLDDWA